jgi:hypothetical protein
LEAGAYPPDQPGRDPDALQLGPDVGKEAALEPDPLGTSSAELQVLRHQASLLWRKFPIEVRVHAAEGLLTPVTIHSSACGRWYDVKYAGRSQQR